MKKNYIAPQVEDIKMDTLMVDFLTIETVSNASQQTAN